MPRQSASFRQYRAEQRRFIFSRRNAQFEPVRRKDIFDATHIVSQADHIVDILKNFKSYTRAGARFGGGAVFYGSAGTGKTMMARYVATQSGARFIDMRQFPVILRSGVHVWQTHDIQNLFSLSEEWASKNRRPIVIFIDQFDNWLKVHMSVASQLEIELDGFSGRREGVYFIATAQEEPEEFGGSIFRSGRIETKVAFSDPDRHQQIELLGGFLSRYPHEPGIDIGNLIHLLNSPSHADLRAFVDEAFVHALREVAVAKAKKQKGLDSRGAKITESLLIDVFLPQALDPETGHTMSVTEERAVAIHEMGHAVVARALGIPAHFVSCRPGLETLGLTAGEDTGLERKLPSIEEIHRKICVYFGSIEAETLLGVPPNVGCNADLHDVVLMTEGLISNGVDPASPLVRKYGRLHFHPNGHMNDEGKKDPPRISEGLKSDLEKAVAQVLKYEQMRTRRVVKFFGKQLIGNVAGVLIAKPNKVMLQGELDRLLEPRLGKFRKKHGIVELK